MPDLTGMDENTARETLLGAGVTGKIHISTTDGDKCLTKSIEAGLICRQNPAPKKQHVGMLDVFLFKQAERESVVLSVPTIRNNITAGEAREIILNAGFIGAIEILSSADEGVECYYTDRKVGVVCGQTPHGGNSAPANTDRQLVVMAERREKGMEDGKRWLRTPPLAGMEVDKAKLDLENLGLKRVAVKEKTNNPDCVPNIVCGSSPEPDQRAFLEATQIIYVGAEIVAEPESAPVSADAGMDTSVITNPDNVSTAASNDEPPETGTESPEVESTEAESLGDPEYEPLFK